LSIYYLNDINRSYVSERSMKALEITDDAGTGNVLLCEMHFKKHYYKIAIASQKDVAVIITDTKAKGCGLCSESKSGPSLQADVMLKVWRGYKKWEKENENR